MKSRCRKRLKGSSRKRGLDSFCLINKINDFQVKQYLIEKVKDIQNDQIRQEN